MRQPLSIATTFAAVLAACSGRPALSWDAGPSSGAGGEGGGGGHGGRTDGGGPAPTRDIDLLFVVDNSGSMYPPQLKLVDAFPTLIKWFEALPGGMPNLHLAVIDADLGAGDGSIVACRGAGSGGAFQHLARTPCTDTTLNPGDTFLSIDGGVANHRLPLAEAFACIAPLGESGCGFERPLAAVVRALGADGRPPPPENVGFLRPDAVLAIVVLTNEDDCSAASEDFFNTTDRTLASRLGPVASFRCNEFGHLCENPRRRPPRHAPTGSLDDTVELTECVPAEELGLLVPVAQLVDQVKALKAYPDQQIVVAAIAGPSAPYVVGWWTPSIVDTGPWPLVIDSCVREDPSFGAFSFASPAIRIETWTRRFGENGFAFSLCDSSYDFALLTLANRVGTLIVP